jgi:hypothetical protein
MTRVLTTESLAAYAANLNRPARGVNGIDHMIMQRVAPIDRAGLLAADPGPGLRLARGRSVIDPTIAEGYASATALGLVLRTGAAGALATLGAVLVGVLG